MAIKGTQARRKLSKKTVSELVVVRLILYRRILRDLAFSGTRYVFSHQLAVLADVTPEQLRRDLMNVRYEGSPTRGYEVVVLEERIGAFLDPPTTQPVALVGVGNLGRALFAYFLGRRPLLQIVAAFDIDPAKVDRMINGCPSYHISEAGTIMREKGINVAMIAVPAAAAQSVADTLVEAGVRQSAQFCRCPPALAADVYVEHIDIGVTLEKVAFFARRPAAAKATGSP